MLWSNFAACLAICTVLYVLCFSGLNFPYDSCLFTSFTSSFRMQELASEEQTSAGLLFSVDRVFFLVINHTSLPKSVQIWDGGYYLKEHSATVKSAGR